MSHYIEYLTLEKVKKNSTIQCIRKANFKEQFNIE